MFYDTEELTTEHLEQFKKDTELYKEKIKEILGLEEIIKPYQKQIHNLRKESASLIADFIYKIDTVEELIKVCDYFKIDINKNLWWIKEAWKNSNSKCPDYNKTEWEDVLRDVICGITEKLIKELE